MQEIIIGDKNTFAIQYSHGQQDERMGYVLLWLGGIYLGAWEDEVFFSYLQSGLQCIIEIKGRLMNFPFQDDLPEVIIQKMSDLSTRDPALYDHVGSFGESFHDFFIICFLTDNKINFVWKLRGKSFFTYPGYPQSTQKVAVDFDYFRSIVEKFDAELILTKEEFKRLRH